MKGATLSRLTTLALTLLAMTAFAGNSLLCRAALKDTDIDAASFTTLRLLSGAFVLWLFLRRYNPPISSAGNWISASALFVYAAAFSYAYTSLTAAAGALLLFGAVQVTMIGYGLWQGERLNPLQITGVTLAVGGLIALLLPGAVAPPMFGAILMLCSGVAWGVYSLRGKGAHNPIAITAGNFSRTVPMALLLSLFTVQYVTPDSKGSLYAIISGALASGAGYAIWYTALRGLTATTAATVQLSVPVFTAAGGIVLLDESLTLHLLLTSIAILGGIALVVVKQANKKAIVSN